MIIGILEIVEIENKRTFLQKPWFAVLVYISFWMALALAATADEYSYLSVDASEDWWSLFGANLAKWYAIAVKTAVVLLVSRLVPQDKLGFWKSLAVFIFAGIIVVLIFSTITILFDVFAKGIPWSDIWIEKRVDFRESLLWHFFLYWLILFFVSLRRFHRSYRQKSIEASSLELENAQLEKKLTEAHLQTLKAQLHPHFLFNTLNAVSSLVRKGDKETTLKLLATFGDLLRRSIDREDTQLVFLKDEIDFIKQYLSIEQLRFKERLKIDYKIEEKTLNAKVPNMILQPIVENAVIHGIAETINGGILEIKAKIQREKLCLQVYNDGPTLAEDWQVTHQSGIGIVNTIERLDKLYKDEFTFEIKNRENKGVIVCIEIPISEDETH